MPCSDLVCGGLRRRFGRTPLWPAGDGPGTPLRLVVMAGAADLTRGDGPYAAVAGPGSLLACPLSLVGGHREGSLVKSAAAPRRGPGPAGVAYRDGAGCCCSSTATLIYAYRDRSPVTGRMVPLTPDENRGCGHRSDGGRPAALGSVGGRLPARRQPPAGPGPKRNSSVTRAGGRRPRSRPRHRQRDPPSTSRAAGRHQRRREIPVIALGGGAHNETICIACNDRGSADRKRT